MELSKRELNQNTNRRKERRTHVSRRVLRNRCILGTITFSLVFALVFSVFASSADTIPGEVYAGDLSNDINRGYVKATFEFGRFPKTDVTDTLGTTLSSLSEDPSNGMISYDGNWYVKQNKNSGTTYKYFLVEPITWQILKIEEDGKVLAISENVLESRSFDVSSDATPWKGNEGKYPMLRLYLNNYNLTGTTNTYALNSPLATPTSTKTYAESSSGTVYRERGFLEKAFTEEERAMLYSDSTKPFGEDGLYVEDKVRLLLPFETSYSSLVSNSLVSAKYGFTYDGVDNGISSNRLGLATPYSEYYYEWSLNTTYEGYDTLQVKTQNYWLAERTNGQDARYISKNGTYSPNECNIYSGKSGVRPVITLNNPDLSNISVKAFPRRYARFSYWTNNGIKNVTELSETYGNTLTLNELKGLKANFVSTRNDTINAVRYTIWNSNDDDGMNKGFINYGYFPNTKVSNTDLIKTLNGLDKRTDGTVICDGEKYVYEVSNWYKFEPIKWQIIDIDKDNNKLKVLSESIIEGRDDDSQKTEKVLWYGTSDGKYPLLRLYLNNYEITNPDEVSNYGLKDNTGYSPKSNLTYKPTNIGTDFYNRGFLEKAFTTSERNKILNDSPEYIKEGYDYSGTLPNNTSEKIRLLSRYEVETDGGSNFYGDYTRNFSFKHGFSYSSGITLGYYSNLLGYVNDYSELRISAATNYLGYEDGFRKTSSWMLLSRQNESSWMVVNNQAYILGNGNSGNRGVRPTFSLDVSSLSNEDGDGSFDSPYEFGHRVHVYTNELDREDIGYYIEGSTKVDAGLLPGNIIRGIYEGTSKEGTLLSSAPNNDTINLTDETELYVDVEITSEAALYAVNNLTAEQVAKMLSNTSYMSLINGSSNGGIMCICDWSKQRKNEIAFELKQKAKNAEYTNLADVKRDISLFLASPVTYKGVTYTPNEALYAWDVSSEPMTHKVMAYYFKDNEGNGTVILASNDSGTNRIMTFNGYGQCSNGSYKVGGESPYLKFNINNYLNFNEYRVLEDDKKGLITPWSVISILSKQNELDDPVNKLVVVNDVYSGDDTNYLFSSLEECAEIDLNAFVFDTNYLKIQNNAEFKVRTKMMFNLINNCTIKMFDNSGYLQEAFVDDGGNNITLDFSNVDMDFDPSLDLTDDDTGACIYSASKIILPDEIKNAASKVLLSDYLLGGSAVIPIVYEVFAEDNTSLGYTDSLLDKTTKFGEYSKTPSYLMPRPELTFYYAYNMYVKEGATEEEKVNAKREFYVHCESLLSKNIIPENVFEKDLNGIVDAAEMWYALAYAMYGATDLNADLFVSQMFDYIKSYMQKDSEIGAGNYLISYNTPVDFTDSDNPYHVAKVALNEYVKKVYNPEVQLNDDKTSLSFLDELIVTIKDVLGTSLENGYSLYKDLFVYEDVDYRSLYGTGFENIDYDFNKINLEIDNQNNEARYTWKAWDKNAPGGLQAGVFAFVNIPVTAHMKITLQSEPDDNFEMGIADGLDNYMNPNSVVLDKNSFRDKVYETDIETVDSLGQKVLLAGIAWCTLAEDDFATLEISVPIKANKSNKIFDENEIVANIDLANSTEAQLVKEVGDYYIFKISNSNYLVNGTGEIAIAYDKLLTNGLIYFANGNIKAYTDFMSFEQGISIDGTYIPGANPITADDITSVDDIERHIDDGSLNKFEWENNFSMPALNMKGLMLVRGKEVEDGAGLDDFFVIVKGEMPTGERKTGSTFTTLFKSVGEQILGVLASVFDVSSSNGVGVNTYTINSFSLNRPSSSADTISIKVNDGQDEHDGPFGLHVNTSIGAMYTDVKVYRKNNANHNIEIPDSEYEISYEDNTGAAGTRGKLIIKAKDDSLNITGQREYEFDLYEVDNNHNGVDDNFEKKIIITKDGEAAGGTVNGGVTEVSISSTASSKEIPVTVNTGYKAVVKISGNVLCELTESGNANITGLDQIAGDVNVTVTFETYNPNPAPNPPGGGGGGGGGGAIVTSPNVSFVLSDDTKLNSELLKTNDKKLKELKFTGNKVTSLPDKLERDGYIFDGWYKDKDFKEKVNVGDYLQGTLSLYAKWKDEKESGNFKAYMKGYDDGEFKPNRPLSRTEVATIVSRLSEGFDEDENYGNDSFPDTRKNFWYSNYIKFAEDNKLFEGYPDGEFKPERAITRGELVKVLVSFSKLTLTEEDEQNKKEFKDIKEIDFFKDQANLLLTKGLIRGYEDGSFKGNNSVTRAEAVTMINSILESLYGKIELKETKVNFKDVKETDWFYEEILKCTSK